MYGSFLYNWASTDVKMMFPFSIHLYDTISMVLSKILRSGQEISKVHYFCHCAKGRFVEFSSSENSVVDIKGELL